MAMNEIGQMKKIVATFLKTDDHLIGPDTIIDKSVIKGSIMIHRMYAAIARELKIEIKNYSKIRTFSQLLQASYMGGEVSVLETKEIKDKEEFLMPKLPVAIGIDMEEIDKMPTVEDFREDPFYKQNFSSKEVSYCLLQPHPLQSFAGKFAAKEAIIKADNSFKDTPFWQIEINNKPNGQPYFADFVISISHTGQLAVAVAVKVYGIK